MKRFIIFTFLALSFYAASAQTQLPEKEKLASLCKIWGFLKYYHPEVATGKLNWDQQLMDRINQLDTINNKNGLSDFYLRWINDLGEIKRCTKCDRLPEDAFTKNLDLQWINDSTLFTGNLIQKLNYIKHNRNQGSNYYVSTAKGGGNTIYENAYKDSLYPSVKMRLLGLFRYWNIIDYFFPYKYKMDEDWNKVLTGMIPVFENAKDTVAYNLAIMHVAAKTDDSHAYFSSKYLREVFGKAFPFFMKIINDSAIVTQIYNDSLAKIDDMIYGDVITKIGSRPISQIVKEVWKYVPASNKTIKYRNIATMSLFFVGQPYPVEVTYVRNSIERKKMIHRYSYKTYDFKPETEETYKLLQDNIGYINLGKLSVSDIQSVIDKFKNTKAIILDVRNYPANILYQLARALNKEIKPFVKFTTPDINYPGMFSFGKPFHCGQRNRKYYKGKIILLVNEST